MHKAIFIDRDGVLNTCVLGKYVNCLDDLEVFEYAGKAVSILNELGYLCLVVSNQSGVASGKMSAETLNEINFHMSKIMLQDGGCLDGFYICMHDKVSGNCSCRKPKPGLILQAADDWDIDLENSWFVGDMETDIQAGIAAGCKTALVLSGLTKSSTDINTRVNAVFDNIFDFALHIKVIENIFKPRVLVR